jgi:hypothetical protein
MYFWYPRMFRVALYVWTPEIFTSTQKMSIACRSISTECYMLVNLVDKYCICTSYFTMWGNRNIRGYQKYIDQIRVLKYSCKYCHRGIIYTWHQNEIGLHNLQVAERGALSFGVWVVMYLQKAWPWTNVFQWRVPHSLHVKDLFCRFQIRVDVLGYKRLTFSSPTKSPYFSSGSQKP